MNFYEQNIANKRRQEGLKYTHKAKGFVQAGGLLAKGQNLFLRRPVLFDNRSMRTVEVDKLKARLGRLRHRVWSWAEALKPVRGSYDLIMLTLTYKNVGDWKPLHIKTFMKGMKKRFPH
jgi:hypothetical protein